MEITCPKCSKGTTFNVTDTISCSHCQTSFNKIKFAKKAMITAWGALAIGGFAGHKIDDFLEPNAVIPKLVSQQDNHNLISYPS